MGTELEAFNVAKKYNKTPSDRAKQLAYERVSFKAVEPIMLANKLNGLIHAARTEEEAVEKET